MFSSCGKALLVSSALCLMPLTDASAHIPEEPGPDPGCTVLEGTRQISLEVIAPHSADFCPLLARAVGEDVLHARVGITPALWHQAGARARVVSTWERGSSRRSRSTTRARPAAGCRRAAGSRSNRLRPGTGRPRRKWSSRGTPRLDAVYASRGVQFGGASAVGRRAAASIFGRRPGANRGTPARRRGPVGAQVVLAGGSMPSATMVEAERVPSSMIARAKTGCSPFSAMPSMKGSAILRTSTGKRRR